MPRQPLLFAAALVLTAALPLLAGSAASAQQVQIDQSFGIFQGSLNVNQYGPLGQEFTPTLSSLQLADLNLFTPANQPGGIDLALNIRQGSINGTLLGTSETVFLPNGYGQNANGIFGLQTRFLFDTPVPLTPGTTEVMELVKISGGDVYWRNMEVGPLFNYPNGSAIFNGAVRPAFDFDFQEGIFAVPEPGSLALLLGSSIGGSLLLKRRSRKK